ncbi:MAG: bifunctional methylenetetrahydrofolate dehydrogenase/methenyltetrahydrofolate cyclohydrolase FolD [Clostridia bacterium]|nr:bifunctional methylenetetrahydrofolate dehydrogenase/methenyltetrahydrofolate cyclohydrolase FolD [Clostridia bacterium]MBQ3471804.1 bifunctional methylenetetrahydrofolate dehydrogenase/methenyltetrahydrofolate cyclohydrolase FolD [Clostridia bacterium]MBQ9599068.1 bifunctional methylenetetrahydrofolate dehydrogenase/methenyltetrahydrofolate cyclohydrolase FolD [Clostridia bacterium]MBR0089327.1 bifunctional methylenetetrahydrofolate dehydrogenase/methenyltetrahydrofolate cyclohydrolase FolD 
MAKLLLGKEVSARIKGELRTEVEELKKQGINPGLAVIIVGEDPASQVYVRNKERACEECGIYSEKYALPEETTQEELLKLIDELNRKESISGILVQLPVPKHIDEKAVINAIDPKKDVDAFHPVNVGKIMVGNYDFVPCTPAGVMELIKESGIDVAGKECVIVGRSNIVGKPQAMLLLHQNGTVTICHSKTQNLAEKTKNADILVAAVGIPEFIKGDMIKEGAVVIDVGINRIAPKKLVGDVEFETAEKVAGAITPVPGGVGPMTIAMLMKNTVKAAIINKSK